MVHVAGLRHALVRVWWRRGVGATLVASGGRERGVVARGKEGPSAKAGSGGGGGGAAAARELVRVRVRRRREGSRVYVMF
jgi:hypothetical protein